MVVYSYLTLVVSKDGCYDLSDTDIKVMRLFDKTRFKSVGLERKVHSMPAVYAFDDVKTVKVNEKVIERWVTLFNITDKPL